MKTIADLRRRALFALCAFATCSPFLRTDGLFSEAFVHSFSIPGPRCTVGATRSIALTPRAATVCLRAAPRPRPSSRQHLQQQAPEAIPSIATAEPVILHINGTSYNLTEWAQSHPGGYKTLLRYHEKDASTAFHAVRHSPEAQRLLETFRIPDDNADHPKVGVSPTITTTQASDTTATSKRSLLRRIRQKLFTKEDPGVHKFLGIFALSHFVYRYAKALTEPTAGLEKFPVALAFLLPHAFLSLSAFIFPVPAERVIGRPMIWREYVGHNAAFAFRSIVCCWLASAGLAYGQHSRNIRRLTTVASTLVVLATCRLADEVTNHWRVISSTESTTATMPYWEGCSPARQRQFKTFYAVSQYGATMACLACSNPFWPFMTLMPIQFASFQLTLVRKGFLSTRAFHFLYAGSLVLPYVWSLVHYAITGMMDIPLSFVLTAAVFSIRTMGVNKYWLWAAVGAGRIAAGDLVLPWKTWL